MTFLEAALEILKRERKPLHYKELTELAMERKLLTFVGRTPEVTMQTQLTGAVKKAPGAPFVRVKPGVFGLLRYPEAVAQPVVVEEKAPAARELEKQPVAEPTEARGRRRRRGGRGRRKDRLGSEEGTAAPPTSAASEATSPEPHEAELGSANGADEHDGPEEPNIGSLSPEDRAAALAESGVLAGGIDEDDSDAVDADSEDTEDTEDNKDADKAVEVEEGLGGEGHGDDDGMSAATEGTPGTDSTAAPVPTDTPPPVAASPSTSSPSAGGAGEASGQGGRKIMSPVDAAIEILKGQAPGRGVHVRQIADSAVRRRLVHGEPNEAWRVLRAALAAEAKERLRAGLRPRIKSAGSGLYALSRRMPDSDLEKAEYVFGEARRALRERTLAAVEQRLGELAPSSFEAIARVVLQHEGFGPSTFVKRVEGTIYVEALRGRGFRPSRCLVALRPGTAAAGRRALGELRAGIRARGQDEGLLLLAGRLSDEAIAEWKQAGQPVEVVDGPALAETCVRHGIGVVSAHVAVDLIDADFFAELSEG
jgi:hypothetical protein